MPPWALLEFLQKGVEEVVAVGHAVGHAGLRGDVTCLLRGVKDGGRYGRTAGTLDECGGIEGVFARVPALVETFGVDQVGRGVDLVEETADAELHAVGALPGVAVRTADPEVDGALGHGPAGE